ncbi:MAG: DUF5615 family PIN-like protein [Deltaproteobacteria bacterium]|nr:DUF5615 family PIN-like protein [Deltaproteobacteria bacterium]
MRLFLDECLSPAIARSLNAEGAHVAMHPRDFGGLGAPDRAVLARCVERDLVLVTANARDFRGLVAVEDVHPGLIILPCVGRARSEALLRAAIRLLSKRGDPMDVMVNRVLEVFTEMDMTLYLLPKDKP